MPNKIHMCATFDQLKLIGVMIFYCEEQYNTNLNPFHNYNEMLLLEVIALNRIMENVLFLN